MMSDLATLMEFIFDVDTLSFQDLYDLCYYILHIVFSMGIAIFVISWW